MKYIILSIFLIVSCRSSTPPEIEICIGDGLGGADCDLPKVGKVYRPPTMLKNYWMTNQEDMARYSSWCYDANYEDIKKLLEKKRKDILSYPAIVPEEDDSTAESVDESLAKLQQIGRWREFLTEEDSSP